MPRYILIDNSTGFILGDTADYAPGDPDLTPAKAAMLLDESLGQHGRSYTEARPGHRPALNESAYHVYQHDGLGNEAFPPIQDGQNPRTIARVEVDCQKVAVIVIAPTCEA